MDPVLDFSKEFSQEPIRTSVAGVGRGTKAALGVTILTSWSLPTVWK